MTKDAAELDIFVIPDAKALTGTYLFCSLYNDNEEFRKHFSDDATVALEDFREGRIPPAAQKIFVRGVFDNFSEGNSRPLKWLTKNINFFAEKMLMFLDTETSGVSHSDKVIQLAYIVTYAGTKVFEYSEYIAWENISIHWGAKKIHGISERKLQSDGLSPECVFKVFDAVCNLCDTIIAYNAPFDQRMMKSSHNSDILNKTSWTCCLKEVRNFKQRSCAFNEASSTKLCDIYRCVTGGKEIVNAHDALGDVIAMISVWNFMNKN